MYNQAAKVCEEVYMALIKKLRVVNSVKELCDVANSLILDELNKIDTDEIKCIAFPASISLNNCVGNYYYEPTNTNYNIIKEGDVVKIEFGVNIGGCIAVLGDTIIKGTNESASKYVDLLEVLKNNVVKLIKHGETNDEVRANVESLCTQYECFPVENTMSYQYLIGQLKTEESKYVCLNYQKYYDDDDNLLVEPNDCFEFQNDEVYTINLTITSESSNNAYSEPHSHHIQRINNYRYNLKLKSSREYYSKVKTHNGFNAFYVSDYLSARDKLGASECINNGIVDTFPILYKKDKGNVYFKKFTVIVKNDNCLVLT